MPPENYSKDIYTIRCILSGMSIGGIEKITLNSSNWYTHTCCSNWADHFFTIHSVE